MHCFHPHAHYGLQIWGQNLSPNSRITKLQKTVVRLMTFSNINSSSKPTNIMTLEEYVFTLNTNLAYQILNSTSPIAIQQTLNSKHLSNRYVTRGVVNNLLKRPPARTSKYGISSIRYQIVLHWNLLQSYYENIDLASIRLSRINKLIQDYLKSCY